MLGQSVGSYRVTGKIAEGGMGAVYRAEHALLGKPAAVKVLLPELSSHQELVERFFTEARAASTIRHPGIVEIFDFGYLADGAAYLVMELLDGEALSSRLARVGRLDERTALTLLRGMAGALAAAHAQGIVHRDLKPDNVFLVPDPDLPGGERPKLLDFGIAKLTDRPGAASLKTRTGAVLGTPTYMSPEQCRGAGQIDARSDLYALGCILYEMLTGRPPFVAEGLGELIAAHMLTAPEPPSRWVPEVSAWAEALTLRLLAKAPGERPGSATELARLLGQGSTPELRAPSTAPTGPVPTSPRLPTGIGASPPPPALATPWPGPPPTTRTTLSAASGAGEAPARRGRAGLVGALAALAAVAGAVTIALVAGSRDGGDPGRAPAVPPVVVDAGEARVAPPVDAGVTVAAPTPAIDAGAVPPPAEPPRVRRSRPRRAGPGTGAGVAVPIEDDI